MTLQILPNWFKKVGLVIFIISIPVGFGQDFFNGLSGFPYKREGIITMFVGGRSAIHFFNVLAILGMLIYMLSREKIEDDYINKLRLESFQLTSIIALIIAIILFAFSKNSELPLDFIIILFFWFYLITFYIKKRIDL